MATEGGISALRATDQKFAQVDTEKLLRKNLGDESLAEKLDGRLAEINHTREFAKQYARTVHDEAVSNMANHLVAIANQLKQQEARGAAEFIAQREAFLAALDSHIEGLRRWKTPFVTAAIMERGFLDDEGIRKESERAIDALKAETAQTLETIKDQSAKAIEGARKLAEEIEVRARRTATGISVEAAQRQFAEARADLAWRVRLWGSLTAVSLATLVIVPFVMMRWELPGGDAWPVAIYHTALRAMVVSGVAALAVLSVRLLRAHLHLAERNRHRARVANSIESFVNSALEPQQRDLILAKLVESIVDFGDSGLIRHERDEVTSPTLSADGVGRILSALTSRK